MKTIAEIQMDGHQFGALLQAQIQDGSCVNPYKIKLKFKHTKNVQASTAQITEESKHRLRMDILVKLGNHNIHMNTPILI